MSPNDRNCSGVGENKAIFTINGQVHIVSDNVLGHTTLNTYIRDYVGLKGTKFMCKEGGCGACVVALCYEHPVTKKPCVKAVNSCLFLVFACHGRTVYTVEGIGSKKAGYDRVQTRLAYFNGTQCGYCTPGMVMSIYSMLKDNPNFTMQEAELGMDGSICRCTGYRPILEASKSLAINASDDLQRKVADIEDLLKVCPKSGIQCLGKCEKAKCDRAPYDCVKKEEEDEVYESKFVELALSSPTLCVKLQSDGTWYKVATVKEIFEIFDMIGSSYQLVGGNTARGIYKYERHPDVYIDINNVVELKGHTFDGTTLSLGANMTLTEAIQLFSAVAQEKPGLFGYAQVIANHIRRVANTPVRNTGTLAGNLSIKHQHREFPSDIFLTLETVGATVTIDNGLTQETMPLLQYFETDMNKKVMTTINLPPRDHMYIVKTYKITPRSVNAKAYVNAGFCFKVDRYNRFRVLELPNIVYGGINPTFGHASRTENYLRDKFVLDLPTLQGALLLLSQEVKPDNKPLEASPEYRLGLVVSLFYKFVLSLNPNGINPKYRSGGDNLIRPLSSGKQDFETDPTMFPLGKPMPKLEALIQCSGEAEYTQDIPIRQDTLFGALVLAPHGPGTIDSLDASPALKVPGVVAFFSAKDIPGKNTFTALHLVVLEFEELFASTKVLYAGQPVGILVAETQEIADDSAHLVIVKYKEKQKPLLDVKAVLKSGDLSRVLLTGTIKPTAIKHDVKYKVSGTVSLGPQYHFTMETHCCLTVPIEGGLEVYAATQWMAINQEAISLALNIPENQITMRVRRIGGGYGCKLTRSSQQITACSLAAYLLQKPVRTVLPIETHMKSTGFRYPNYTEYEAGVNENGVIQYLMASIYEDAGVALNDPVVLFLLIPAFPMVYDSSTWSVNGYDVKTDKATTAWARGPGTLEAGAIIEHIMEHIAVVVDKDPLEVKLNNTIPGQYPIADMISYLKVQSDYENRLNATILFNKANVWKKRGIAFLPTRFPLQFFARYHATVSIYSQDGTVVITHGGIELGQGINTKAAQACAHALGIGIENIVVKPTNNITAPNNEFTGNSLTTECVVLAVIKCCNVLLERLKPVRAQLPNPTWKALIRLAHTMFVNLFASEMMSPPADKVVKYDVFGVTVIEIELDVLTGEYQILRADILEDAGRSFNPTLDVGQIEGAFVMGLGYFTSEELKYDQTSGWLLTDRTWHYKVPLATDIPIDFRVYIKKNGDNPLGILRTKAVGEPPILMSCAVMSAVRHAIASARKDLGNNDWFELDAPMTREKVFLTVKSSRNNYVL